MAIPEETVQRVRGYLTSQAATMSLAELVDKVRADADSLRDAALAVPDELLFERLAGAGPEAWSPAEVLTHVLQANAICAGAIETMIETGECGVYLDATNEQRPVPAAGMQSAEAYWHALCEQRERLFARVLSASGDEYPAATLQHQWFGPLTWRETLLFLRLHDGDHSRGLQAIAAVHADR
jgi:hypothetical protein